MNRPNRLNILCAIGLAFACTSGTAHARGFPEQPVRFLVGFPAGGATDIAARAIAQKLAAIWKHPAVVENRTGASGAIAAGVAKNAAPDGYTVLFASSNEMTITPALVSKLNYDPVRDFVPVSLAVATPAVILTHPSLPAQTLQELIALAKSKPGSLSYGATGPGSPQHLAGELLKMRSGADLLYVPYKGGAPLITDLTGTHISVGIAALAGTVPHIESGRVRALAVTTAKRSSVAPDLPTVAESGLKDFDMSQWFGIFLPKGTPQDVVDTLGKDIAQVLRMPDLRKQLEDQGLEAIGSTPLEFSRFMENELAKNAKIVADAGIKLE